MSVAVKVAVLAVDWKAAWMVVWKDGMSVAAKVAVKVT